MDRSHTDASCPWARFVALAIVAVVLLGGCGTPGDTGGDTPGPTPTEGPSEAPAPSPTAVPTPSRTPGDGIEVALETQTGHDVRARIRDDTGALLRAASGVPGDGMSVRWYDALVEQVDGRTIRIVWVMLPMDGEVGVEIRQAGAGLGVRLVQPQPPDNSDAVGFDRVLLLEFDRPIVAASVVVTIERSPGS